VVVVSLKETRGRFVTDIVVIEYFLALALVLGVVLGVAGAGLDVVLEPFLTSSERSDAVRQSLTLLGWQIFLGSAFLGRGAGSFEYLVAVEGGTVGFGDVTNAHNVFAEVAAQYGLIVMVPLMVVLVATARRGPPHRQRGVGDGHLGVAVMLGTVAIFVSGLGASSTLVSPWWWALVGSTVAAASVKSAADIATPKLADSAASMQPGRNDRRRCARAN